MKPKQKTIKLRYDALDGRYHVVQVTNSIEYTPGTTVDKNTAEYLCGNRGWTVTVVNQ